MIPAPTPSTPPVLSADLERIDALRANIERVVIGKSESVRLLITALLARGHALIEDIPGIGKTSLARALTRSIDCAFKRIQFTPDLLPSDVIGMSVFDTDRKEFVFQPGPVFANILLADEINRATPRTQAALLEAMNETQVSVDGRTYPLGPPFMVIATQNPLEFTGTYPLPESQLDRFLMVLRLGYPTAEEERRIVFSRNGTDPLSSLEPVMTGEDLRRISAAVSAVRMDEALVEYVVRLSHRTRRDPELLAGVSPRGTLHLTRAARAHAVVQRREYVLPDDVKAVALPVLTHRVIPKRRQVRESRTSTAEILARILDEVPVPE